MQQRSLEPLRDAVDLIQGGSPAAFRRSALLVQNYSHTHRRPSSLSTLQALDWKQWQGGAPEQPFNAERFYLWRWFWNSGGGAMDRSVHPLD